MTTPGNEFVPIAAGLAAIMFIVVLGILRAERPTTTTNSSYGVELKCIDERMYVIEEGKEPRNVVDSDKRNVKC